MKVTTRTRFTAATLLFSSSVVLAAPTYLSCKFVGSKGTPQVKGSVIRDRRMVGEKDGGTCKTISHAQSGFEE